MIYQVLHQWYGQSFHAGGELAQEDLVSPKYLFHPRIQVCTNIIHHALHSYAQKTSEKYLSSTLYPTMLSSTKIHQHPYPTPLFYDSRKSPTHSSAVRSLPHLVFLNLILFFLASLLIQLRDYLR